MFAGRLRYTVRVVSVDQSRFVSHPYLWTPGLVAALKS